jgi:hypothetical protein
MKIRPLAAALVIAFTPAALGLHVTPAFAQDDATTAAARARFREGVEFYDKGQYENARAAFLQAYALKKHPDVLYNLAFSSLKSNHPLEADKYFAQFLREAQNIAPAKRAEAEKGRDEARAKLGRIDVSAAAGTEVMVDNDRIGTAPLSEPVLVDPGAHTVKFKAPGGETDTQSISVLAGQQVTAKYKGGAAATPVPVPTPTPTPTPTPSPTPADTTPTKTDTTPAPSASTDTTPPSSSADTGTKSKNLFAPPANMVPVYIGGAIAVAAFGTSIVMLIVKGNAQSNADSVAAAIRSKGGHAGVCSSSNAQDVATFGKACSALNDDNNAVNTDAAIGNVALGVGVLAVLATGAYYLAGTKKDSTSTVTASAPRPVVAPMIGPRVGGLSISGSF